MAPSSALRRPHPRALALAFALAAATTVPIVGTACGSPTPADTEDAGAPRTDDAAAREDASTPEDASLASDARPADRADASDARDANDTRDANDGGANDGGPTDNGTPTIALGTYHSCALLTNGSVKCWGWNEAGRLGLGDGVQRGSSAGQMGPALPAVSLGVGRTARSITVGGAQTCGILNDTSLKCWGSNVYGQSGLGAHTVFGDAPGEMGDALPPVLLGVGRTARTVVAGDSHTCAILDNGTVKCWGSNEYGKLGLGDTANRGDEPGEMGDALPVVDLGAGRTTKALAAGRYHTCALLDDGSVKCWGRNLGQLGQGDVADRGDAPGEMGNALAPVPLGTGRRAIAVSVGEGHSCALLDDRTVKCWGMNYYGELGQGDSVYRGDQPGELGDALPAILLGAGRTAKTVVAGGSHTCVVLDDDTLKCWGSNNLGELGRGYQGDYGNRANQMGDALAAIDLGAGKKVKELASGYSHLCVRLDDLSLRCWGWNAFGQLGQGNTSARGDNPGEMGSALPAVDLGP